MEDDNDSCGAKRLNKAMSPGSMQLPTMNNWDMSQAMSPYLPPDMNSIASGSMMNNGPPQYNNSRGNNGGSNAANNPTTNGMYDMATGQNANDYLTGNGPLSHLSESVNSLDPLNAMEKSLNEQVTIFSFLSIFGCFSNVFLCISRCLTHLTHRTHLIRPTHPVVVHQVRRRTLPVAVLDRQVYRQPQIIQHKMFTIPVRIQIVQIIQQTKTIQQILTKISPHHQRMVVAKPAIKITIRKYRPI